MFGYSSLHLIGFLTVFATTLILFPLYALLTGNIILLVVGPVILLGLSCAHYFVGKRPYVPIPGRTAASETEDENRNEGNEDETLEHNGHPPWWNRYTSIGWRDVRDTLGEGAKFWIAVLSGVAVQALLVFAYVKLNPFVGLP